MRTSWPRLPQWPNPRVDWPSWPTSRCWRISRCRSPAWFRMHRPQRLRRGMQAVEDAARALGCTLAKPIRPVGLSFAFGDSGSEGDGSRIHRPSSPTGSRDTPGPGFDRPAPRIARTPESHGNPCRVIRATPLDLRGRVVIDTHILVIGAGIAGLSMTLQLPRDLRVMVVTKRALGESNTWYAQGGLAAAVGPMTIPISISPTPSSPARDSVTKQPCEPWSRVDRPPWSGF